MGAKKEMVGKYGKIVSISMINSSVFWKLFYSLEREFVYVTENRASRDEYSDRNYCSLIDNIVQKVFLVTKRRS